MTRMPSDFEIENLSERSWARVEDNVFDELARDAEHGVRSFSGPPARWSWSWRHAFALGGVTAAAAVAVLAMSGGETGGPAPLRTSRVVTADDSSQVTIGEASLDVAPRTALVASGDDEHGVLVIIERGSVDFAIPPRGDRPPFAVQSGDVRIEVIGTKFSVTRDGESAVVEVTEGTVKVTGFGETALVHPGEVWLTPSPADDGDIADDDAVIDMRPIVVKRDAPERKRKRIARDRRPPTEPAPPAAPTTAKQRYETAASLERTDPEAAIAIYRELARGRDGWAANALYAHARLEHDRARPSDAEPLFRAYLRRFPAGPNAEEARRLLEQIR